MQTNAREGLTTRSLVALAILNFFLADARDGLGPFLDGFLATRGWSPMTLGIVATLGGVLGMVATPLFGAWVDGLAAGRFLPTLVLFGALWLLFLSLTPSAYRSNRYPKWPGALFVSSWWLGVSILLPKLLASVFSYDLTYGSLAGVMIALFFFWLVGIGMVIGAELNAALAETPEEQDMLGQVDNRARAIRQAGATKPE